MTEEILQQIWMLSRRRQKPWALVRSVDGRLLMYQHDQPFEGELLGIYDHPSLVDLREDLKAVTYG